MSIRSTQLTGMEDQITNWIPIIEAMDEFEPTDNNFLYNLVCALEDARDEIFYALRQEEDEGRSPTVV